MNFVSILNMRLCKLEPTKRFYQIFFKNFVVKHLNGLMIIILAMQIMKRFFYRLGIIVINFFFILA